ncbi:transglutaminase domain-containing protein [Puniceicoccaceae bacterium K14]|nr:transglutaminase domain-containing protein [Puniceicoccaceae bacterium K14]
MIRLSFKTLLCALTFTAVTLAALAKPIIEGEDSFEFAYRATLPEISEPARLWLPIAQSNKSQKVEITSIDAPGPYTSSSEERFGNRVLFMEVDPKMSGQTVEVNYRVHRYENTGTLAENPEEKNKFLKASSLVPNNERLAKIAQDATQESSLPGTVGPNLYWHTLEQMSYDKSGDGWGRGDAIYACDAKTGNCTDFHSYFIALARTLDVPARFSIGFTIPSDHDKGIIGGYHCWAEYLNDDNWIPVDISEADKHPELKDYFLGNHPANRFQFTVGRDLELNPSPKSGTVNYLIYPLFEIAGKQQKIETEFAFQRIK